MRLTLLGNRLALAAVASAWAALAGCQRLPYIDQSKAVPHDSLGTIAAGGQGGQAGQLPEPLADSAARRSPSPGRPTTPRPRRSGR